MTDCTYCGCAVEAHRAVFVSEAGDVGTRAAAGAFCNYACLAEYIEEAGQTEGAFCALDA